MCSGWCNNWVSSKPISKKQLGCRYFQKTFWQNRVSLRQNKHNTQLTHIRAIKMDSNTCERQANVKLDWRKRNVKLRGQLHIMLYLQYLNHHINHVRLNTNISERRFMICNWQKEFYKTPRISLNHRFVIVTSTMSPTLTSKCFACDILFLHKLILAWI